MEPEEKEEVKVTEPTQEPESAEPEISEKPCGWSLSSCPYFCDLKSKWIFPIRQNLQIYSSLFVLPLLAITLIDKIDHTRNTFNDFMPLYDFAISVAIIAAFFVLQVIF